MGSTATSSGSQPVSVVFVCLGNICRSTLAEGVFQHLTKDSKPAHPLISRIDSAGTGAYHVGDGPDSRTIRTLADNGITSYRHKARQFQASDLSNFDYVLAMDDDNLDYLLRLRTRTAKKLGVSENELAKVSLFGDYGDEKGEEVADPYYGGSEGFVTAYHQMIRFTKGLLEHIEAEAKGSEEK